MFNTFNNLQNSTKAYLVALVLLLAQFFDGGGIIFAVAKLIGLILIIIGVYYSYKDFRQDKPYKRLLEEKAWYRFIKILGYILFVLGIASVLGQGESSERFFAIYLILYIFFARLVKYIFYYIILGSKFNNISR